MSPPQRKDFSSDAEFYKYLIKYPGIEIPPFENESSCPNKLAQTSKCKRKRADKSVQEISHSHPGMHVPETPNPQVFPQMDFLEEVPLVELPSIRDRTSGGASGTLGTL